jgi:hypothetical protein
MLDPLLARALVSAAVEATLAIAVSHPVRASVRAATHLVAADLTAALRDQPAVGEAIAWAVVASAVEDAAAEVVVAVEEVGGNRLLEERHLHPLLIALGQLASYRAFLLTAPVAC